VEVQLVTSAVRPIPPEWAKINALHLVVSIDGLQPDHDKRRAPASYERILQNIVGRDSAGWGTGDAPGKVKFIAVLSIIFWTMAIVTGRLTAYI